jgi:hypothetical protein
MAIDWPDALVRELAERRCVLVMGAGVSMGSVGADGLTHPPDWKGFLNGALALVHKEADKRFAATLIKRSQFLDAAEVILASCNRPDFGDYLRREFVNPHFSQSKLHEIVLEIDPKIIVTTNYDQIYDHYCNQGRAANGYNICRYHDTFHIDNIRSTVRLVIKAHGCVSDPTKVVLSRSSYYSARRDHPGFYQLLDAIFLTHTLLFIGCSLTDPDIQLVLENANISVPSSHPHYALVEKSRHPSIKAALKMTHNIDLIEYPKGNHKAAEDALSALKDMVMVLRTLPV